MKKYFSIVFILILSFAYTQEEVDFEHISTDQGLPANYIRTIHQDDKGFLWFGMRGACCRFDGFEFKTFPVATSTGSHDIETWVSEMVSDHNKRFWVGEVGQFGLLRFDYNKEVFINCFNELNLPSHIRKIHIYSMMCDSKGILWIGCSGNIGVIRFDPETGESKLIRFSPDNKHSLPIRIIRKIIEDKKGTVWIGTTSGLYWYDSVRKLFIQNKELEGEDVNHLISDSDNILWASVHEKGLYKYNLETDILKKHFFNLDHKEISLKGTGEIFEDSKKHLWIASERGLIVADKAKNTCKIYMSDKVRAKAFNSSIVKKMFGDREGNFWIGTNEGIIKFKNQRFKTFRYSAEKNSISMNKIQYFLERQDGNIWIATPHGIDVLNRETEQFTLFTEVKNNNSGLSGPPMAFCNDNVDGAWIGTFSGGLNYFDKENNSFTSYFSNDNNLSNSKVFSILVDNKNFVWIGTWGDGLIVLNKNNEKLRYLKQSSLNKTSIPSNFIHTLYIDSKNRIWVGTVKGIALLEDRTQFNFRQIINSETFGIEKEITGYDFIETKFTDDIWIASSYGLLRYDVSGDSVIRYSKKDGLPTSQIMGILEDDNGKLWISTSKGLVVATPDYENENDNTKLRIKIFEKQDGLQGNEFLPASCCKLHDGTMLFGGSNGFSMFHPDSIKGNPTPPSLAFTGLEISNIPVKIGQEINGQIILDKSITQKKHLFLNSKNNIFGIEFVALHLTQPFKNQYRYMLEGFDAKWQYTTSTNRKARYMNLKGGEYVLRVNAANCDGIWNEEGIELKVSILPPWWQTWWFTIAWIILLILSIFSVVKVRTYNLQIQKHKLERIVELRTIELQEMNLTLRERSEELEQQMEQKEKMNEEITLMNKQLLETNKKLENKTNEVKQMANRLHQTDQSKLRFFANISHEFRTPLTLILGPIEKCLDLKQPIFWEGINISNYINLIYKNSKRLIRLVNQIIDFRKLDQGQKKLLLTNNNIIEFANEIVNAFLPLAEAKHLSLNIKHLSFMKNQPLCENIKRKMINDFWFDPDVMEKILYNLISNAIKYTPEGGKISISIGTVETNGRASLQNNQLEIEISDTGIGIKPENLSKIFDRFYRVETHSHASTHENLNDGTGIGLAYTKELIKLHKGQIDVKSVPQKGTSFTLRFAIDENDVGENELNDSTVSHNLKYTKSMMESDSDWFKRQMTPDGKANTRIRDEEGSNHAYIEKSKGESKQKYSILIVEDNDDLRSFIKSELKDSYTIHEAENGLIAWKIMIKVYPDLILSDVMMPEMDGVELCQKIKQEENTSHIPVILITAKSGELEMIRGLETGADDYISKPFNVKALKLKIENLFLTRKRLQEKFKQTIDLNPSKITHSVIDEKFLQKAINVVNDNMQRIDLDNDQFVSLMGYSRTVVYTKIKRLTGQSVGEFIRNLRLKAAAHLFMEGNDNISEVCYQIGFKHLSFFTRHFNKMFGKTPSQFVKECLNK